MECIRRKDTQTSTKIWRPWDEETSKTDITKCVRLHPYMRCSRSNQMERTRSSHPLQSYINTFKHPVRLYWTKAAYDYMYEAGERLLRNFPVQATIQVIDDSDSSDDEDEDDDDGDGDDDDGPLENDVKDIFLDDKEITKVEDKKQSM